MEVSDSCVADSSPKVLEKPVDGAVEKEKIPRGRTSKVTMTVPGETEAGSAGKQPCRGIPWWAHRDDDRSAAASLPRFKKHIGSVDPNALKIQSPQGAKCRLNGERASPSQTGIPPSPRRCQDRAKRACRVASTVGPPYSHSEGRSALAWRVPACPSETVLPYPQILLQSHHMYRRQSWLP